MWTKKLGFGGTEIAQVCYTVEWCGCGGETDYKSLELKWSKYIQPTQSNLKHLVVTFK